MQAGSRSTARGAGRFSGRKRTFWGWSQGTQLAALCWTRAGDVGGTKWEEGFAKGGGVQQVERGDRGKGGFGLAWFGLAGLLAARSCVDAVWMRRLFQGGRHLGPDFGFWRARYGLLLQ